MLQFLCLPNGKNSKFKSRDSAPCNYWTWLCFAAQPHRVTICGCLLPATTKANHTLWIKLLARLTFWYFLCFWFFSGLKEWKLATVHSSVSRVPKLNGFKYWKISSKVLRRRIVWLVAKTHVARQTNVAAASCCKLLQAYSAKSTDWRFDDSNDAMIRSGSGFKHLAWFYQFPPLKKFDWNPAPRLLEDFFIIPHLPKSNFSSTKTSAEHISHYSPFNQSANIFVAGLQLLGLTGVSSRRQSFPEWVSALSLSDLFGKIMQDMWKHWSAHFMMPGYHCYLKTLSGTVLHPSGPKPSKNEPQDWPSWTW